METELKSGRHLYGRGWLGLIPLVGGFVGLGLLALGLFKYKDKKLALIGLAALLFTVGCYGYLFYDLKYGVNSSKAYSKISQEQLNNLPKQIELYKMQFGEYPDSLQQLHKSDKFLIISDPLFSRKLDRNMNIFYKYKRFGDKYTIFSAGVDGVSNTSDDLYPIISPNDKLNYGLVNLR